LEYPAAGSELSECIVKNPFQIDADGLVRVRDKPGLGVEVDIERIKPYYKPVRIQVDSETVFDQPSL